MISARILVPLITLTAMVGLKFVWTGRQTQCGWTEGPVDRHVNTLTDRQTDRQTGRQTITLFFLFFVLL